MDRIDEMFEIQSLGDEYFYDKVKFLSDKKYRLEVVKEFVLGIHDQSNKIMDAFEWKKHSISAVENTQNAIEQLIDVNKYTLGLLMLLGVSPETYYDNFMSKSNVLLERWKSLDEKITSNTKVVIFDIDGVIADYDKAYRKFLEDVKGFKCINSSRVSYSYYNQYGISKMLEESIHSEFIEQGGFQTLEPYSGIKELINSLKSEGIKIVLLTARPSWLHKRLIIDTYEWLKKYDIKYDFLFWDKDKSETVVRYVFPADILAFIEDRDKHAIEISHLGIDVLLVDKTYNQNVYGQNNIHRVNNNQDIYDFIIKKIRGENEIQKSKSRID